jgi:hypothetical protein
VDSQTRVPDTQAHWCCSTRCSNQWCTTGVGGVKKNKIQQKKKKKLKKKNKNIYTYTHSIENPIF